MIDLTATPVSFLKPSILIQTYLFKMIAHFNIIDLNTTHIYYGM